MKLIGVTQRIDIIKEYGEKRDAIDVKWTEFLLSCGYLPIFIPNNIEAAKKILYTIELNGILLTGGNSLEKYGGDAPERDIVETFCLEYAILNRIPVLGVCRGMQVIQDYFDVKLEKVTGHVKREQAIMYNNKEEVVNSYHNFGAKQSVEKLKVVGASRDGIVKAVKHVDYNITGIMWHPERIYPFSDRDKKLLSDIFTEI